MEVASTEGLAVGPGYAAVPLSNPTHSILGDFRRAFHVLQHCFQRHVGGVSIGCVSEAGRTKEECLISSPNQLSSTAKLANQRGSTGCLVFGGCSRAHRSRPS